MEEKDLFSKETFINLFNLSDIDRIEQEDKLFIEAKKLGVEKRFKESLKKYQGLLKEKIPIDDNSKLPQCKYDISNFTWGNYSCNIDGITDRFNTKFSYIPVIPVERYINEDTGKEKVKIIFYKENEWKELIVDKSQLSINNKLLLLRMFKFMYSTDSGLRQKTRSEVLDAYSATDVIIDKSNSDMTHSLINIINDNRINNTVRIGNINGQAR